jgi:hypothetical protein
VPAVASQGCLLVDWQRHNTAIDESRSPQLRFYLCGLKYLPESHAEKSVLSGKFGDESFEGRWERYGNIHDDRDYSSASIADRGRSESAVLFVLHGIRPQDRGVMRAKRGGQLDAQSLVVQCVGMLVGSLSFIACK